MLDIESIDSLDFYFNGKWLSEFNGIIAGKDGVKQFSILPQLEIKTEKVLGRDGELVYSSNYQPRTFSVPVLFNDITKIREIASWLNARTPQEFYFKNDRIKIKAMFDSAIDLEAYYLQGIVELKFISHQPFYTALEDIKYSFTKFDRSYTYIDPLSTFNAVNVIQYDRYTPTTFELINSNEEEIVTTDNQLVYVDGMVTKNGESINVEIPSWNNIEIFNDGNKESYPIYTIVGRGQVVITLNGSIIFTVNLDTNADETIMIDTFYCTSYYNTTNKISKFSGEFITLPSGYNLISVTGTCTRLDVQCNSQWI